MANGRIDENGLPVYAPGDFDYVRVVDRSTGASRNALAPEVTAAARQLSDALGQIVADAEADIAPVIAGLGYLPPVPYASGLNVDSTRFTVIRDGQVYAPAAPVPFTTGAWDAHQWRLIQGVTGADLAAESGAAMVGFKQAGPFARARSLRGKSREQFSLFDVIPESEHAAIESGTSTYDATADINAAAEYCGDNGIPLFGNPGAYLITDTVKINCDGDLGRAEFRADGRIVPIAVRIGPDTGFVQRLNIIAPRVVNIGKTSAGFSGFEDSVGLELTGLNECNVTVPHIKWFGVGLDCGSYTGGFSYNNITLQMLETNRINLRLWPKAVGGWCNENTFTGGRYMMQPSQVGDIAGTRQVLLRAHSLSDGGGPNNNVFIKPSLEADSVEFMLDIMGQYNQVVGARYEGDGKRVRFYAGVAENTHSNLLIGGYHLDRVEFVFDGEPSRNNSLLSARSIELNGSKAALSLAMGAGSAPHVVGYPAGKNVLGSHPDEGDWTYHLSQLQLQGKISSDVHPRVRLDFSTGRVYVGNSSSPPTAFVGPLGSSFVGASSSWVPTSTGSLDLGISTLKWRNIPLTGSVGFFGSNPRTTKPVVTGSTEGNAALASLISALASYGLVQDETDP